MLTKEESIQARKDYILEQIGKTVYNATKSYRKQELNFEICNDLVDEVIEDINSRGFNMVKGQSYAGGFTKVTMVV